MSVGQAWAIPASRDRHGHRHSDRRSIRRPGTGQATVETALGLTVLVLCIPMVMILHGVIDARLQVETLATETARVMSEATSAEQARVAAEHRFQQVAAGLALPGERLTLAVSIEPGLPRGSLVIADVSYQLPLAHLPFGLGDVTLRATARLPVQRHGNR